MNNLGYLYIQQGRSDAALPPLARAVEIRGNVPVFQNNFGTALERSGHFVAAREAYGKALEADSTYAKAAVGLERVTAHGAASDTLDGGRAGAGAGIPGRDRAVADAAGDGRFRREAGGLDAADRGPGDGLDADGEGFGAE